MRGGAKVFRDLSSIATTGQPLAVSTKPMILRVVSRSVMGSFGSGVC